MIIAIAKSASRLSHSHVSSPGMLQAQPGADRWPVRQWYFHELEFEIGNQILQMQISTYSSNRPKKRDKKRVLLFCKVFHFTSLQCSTHFTSLHFTSLQLVEILDNLTMTKNFYCYVILCHSYSYYCLCIKAVLKTENNYSSFNS